MSTEQAGQARIFSSCNLIARRHLIRITLDVQVNKRQSFEFLTLAICFSFYWICLHFVMRIPHRAKSTMPKAACAWHYECVLFTL